MDAQWIINSLFGICAAGFGWFLNSMYQAHQTLRAEVNADRAALAEYKLKVAEQYITRRDMERIESKLDQALAALANKQDRE